MFELVECPCLFCLSSKLSTLSDTGEMQPFPLGYMHMNFEDAQAVLNDYSNAILYERGQLNPDEHQASLDDKAATYTLTNVVPQVNDTAMQNDTLLYFIQPRSVPDQGSHLSTRPGPTRLDWIIQD